MKTDWINLSLDLAAEPGHFFSGARKIIRNRSYTFKNIKPDLLIEDAGYTQSKLTMLRRLYYHEESHSAAIKLWERRVGQRKYGSVSFTCFNHLTKSDPDKKSKRASVMGPCLQSVSLTYMPDHTCAVDVFYRTTELFKKFPADLVFLRDQLLPSFNLFSCPLKSITFHFANITIHPMYFVTILPHLSDPFGELEEIKHQDKYFYDWMVKWTARYVCPEYNRGIQKFAQAMRVHKDAHERIRPNMMKPLQEYLIKNHPGYRSDYVEGEDDDE